MTKTVSAKYLKEGENREWFLCWWGVSSNSFRVIVCTWCFIKFISKRKIIFPYFLLNLGARELLHGNFRINFLSRLDMITLGHLSRHPIFPQKTHATPLRTKTRNLFRWTRTMCVPPRRILVHHVDKLLHRIFKPIQDQSSSTKRLEVLQTLGLHTCMFRFSLPQCRGSPWVW